MGNEQNHPRISVQRMMDIIKAPDFSTGGYLLYDKEQIKEIYETGRGSFKVRAKYSYNKKDKANSLSFIY